MDLTKWYIIWVMNAEFATTYPKLKSPEFAKQLRRENLYANAGLFNPEEIDRAFRIVECAQKIAPAVCGLAENQGKMGFVMAITKRGENSPTLTILVGNVTDPDDLYASDGKLGKYCIFANLKAQVLKDHPEFISSSQNSSLPRNERIYSPVNQEIPGGAIAFDDLIISVSAFKNPDMDTATTLAIAAGSGVTNIDGAEKLAKDPRVNCKEFMINEDEIFVIPILH